MTGRTACVFYVIIIGLEWVGMFATADAKSLGLIEFGVHPLTLLVWQLT